MKKFLILVVMIFSFPIMSNALESDYVSETLETTLKEENISYDLSNYTSSEDKVNIYLFRGSGCSHCRDFLRFVSNTLVKEYGEYFNLISYEVWGNKNNASLQNSVMKHFAITKGGVPLIVIGDKYFHGYGTSSNSGIIEAIMDEYNSSTRTDVVKRIIDGEEDSENNEETVNGTDATMTAKSVEIKDYDTKEIILIAFVIFVLVGTVGTVLILFWPGKGKLVK